jgi:hypothetical protein
MRREVKLLKRIRRRFLIAVGLAAFLVPLVGAGVAKADPVPTTVQIAQNAQYISQFQIDLQVSISCTPGFGYIVNATVVQPQGFFQQQFGNGFAFGQCTGQHQKVAVTIFGFGPGWQLDDAVASVVACAGPCDADTRTIHIVL